MPSLQTENELRASWSLRFCYLCGRDFSDAERRTRDHVPPRSAFPRHDRVAVLRLPAHAGCNTGRSQTDEAAGQLLGLARGRPPKIERNRLHLGIVPTDTPEVPFLVALFLDLDPIIARWVRGCHAALYREFLPGSTRCVLHAPLQHASFTGSALELDPLLPEQPLIVKLIKKNRVAGRIDRIRAWNGQFTYECVWVLADDGSTWGCFFTLDVYRWKGLGSMQLPQQSCVGAYFPVTGRPATSSVATSLEVPYTNLSPLDAFAP